MHVFLRKQNFGYQVMKMNLSQLEYIIEVAKSGNISIASQNLFVSQAGISQSITNLEEELGVKIFNRSRAGTILTEEGNIIVKKAEEIIEKLLDLKHGPVHELITHKEVKFSLTPGLMPVFQKNLNSFKLSFPNININVSEKESEFIIEDVRQNKADIGVIGMHKNSKVSNDLVFESILRSKIKVFVHPQSSLINPGRIISPQQLLDQSIVLYKSQTFIGIIDQLRKKYGYSHSILISNHYETIKKMIIEQSAVSMFTEFYSKNDPQVLKGEIVPLTLLNYDQDFITYGCIYSRHNELASHTREMLEYTKDQIKRHF